MGNRTQPYHFAMDFRYVYILYIKQLNIELSEQEMADDTEIFALLSSMGINQITYR